MRIYVGNLSFEVRDTTVKQLFEPFGAVTAVEVVADRISGNSRGFAFVEMGNNTEAQAAIDGLNGTMLQDRALAVSAAKTPKPRPSSGGGWQDRERSGWRR